MLPTARVCSLITYVLGICVQVVGTVLYVVTAALHRNRQRHDEDSLQQRLIIENQLHSTHHIHITRWAHFTSFPSLGAHAQRGLQ